MNEMEMYFNKHYIRVDAQNRITNGFSDAFTIPLPQPGETDILINDKGGRHFRLILDGKPTHENPCELMRDENGIPLLNWNAQTKTIERRTQTEIDADRPPIQPPMPTDKERIDVLEAVILEIIKHVYQ